MARVEVATLGWGVLQDEQGNAKGGLTPSISGTVYASSTGGTTIPAASWESQSDGTLLGYLEVGTYTFTEPLDGTTRTVDVISGEDLDRLAVLLEASFNVKDYGAVGTGATDDTAVFASVLTAIAAAGGGTLYIPVGTYLLSSELIVPDNVIIQGAGRNVTVLKASTGHTTALLRATYSGSVYGSLNYLVLRDLTLDGDSMNSSLAEAAAGWPLLHAYNSSGVKAYRCDFKNGRSYGLGFQGYPTQANTTARGPVEDFYGQGCRFYSNGFRKSGDTTTLNGAITDSATTITLTSAAAFAATGTVLIGSEKIRYTGKAGNDLTGCVRGSFATTAAAGSNGATVAELALYDDGLDCKSSQRLTMTDCQFYGNADDGCDIRAHYLSLSGCYGWANGNGGVVVSVALPGGSMSETDGFAALIGCFGWSNLVNGLRVEAPEALRIGRFSLTGCGGRDNGADGLDCNGSGGGEVHVVVQGGHYCNNTASGIRLNTCTEASVVGAHANDNIVYGAQVANMPEGAAFSGFTAMRNARGIRLTGTSDKLRLTGSKLKSNGTADLTLTGTQNRIDRSNDTGMAIDSIASAAALTLSDFYDYFTITGSTTITSVTASYVGRVVTLKFTSTAQVTDGSNLKLASNFTGAADRTLTLVCDGTNWYEIARSAN